ncbi:MAG: STAS domain-containing protein [Planctomycetes bacterium]|nr:STAS domain-containing protein [Planctomycetota bacterium]
MDNYKINNGVLSVLKDLRQEFDLSFDQACGELLQQETDNLIIDLAMVSYISSTYIGMIAATFFQAQAKGKNLQVRARANVLQVLRAAGFDGFIKLESI